LALTPAANCAIAAAPISLRKRDVRLLLTRPQPDAEHTAAALRSLGHSVFVAPLLRIETLANAEIGQGPWAGILVTSANAARAVAQHRALPRLLGLPVIAAGNSSSEAMRAADFRDVVSAAGGENEVVTSATQRFKAGASLLYLAGADRFGDLAGDLKSHGIAVDTVVVYRAVPAVLLPAPGAEAFARGIDGVLHFSRRSAATYVDVTLAAQLRQQALETPLHFCLSRQVADPLAEAGARQIQIAPEPTEAALIALIRGI
jgi:uroporphyrinogen-III synthase